MGGDSEGKVREFEEYEEDNGCGDGHGDKVGGGDDKSKGDILGHEGKKDRYRWKLC